jgi:hypothetical protein
VEKLAEANRLPIAKMICRSDKELRDHLINCLTTNENCKGAATIIKEFRLDINDYPEVKERMLKASCRYYIGLYLYKKPGDADYMSLKKIEDLFLGIK